LIFIDHQDAFAGPVPVDGSTPKSVLQRRRFTMLQHLLRTGLTNIDHRQPVAMMRLDLARKERVRAEARG
jgi:hypothetical protein